MASWMNGMVGAIARRTKVQPLEHQSVFEEFAEVEREVLRDRVIAGSVRARAYRRLKRLVCGDGRRGGGDDAAPS